MALTDRVRIVSVASGEGGTLTSASVTGLTPTLMEGYNLVEHNKAKVIAAAKEAREIGVIGKPLKDLLLSRITEIDKSALKTSSLPGNQSVILPYSYRRRKTRIGNHQFTIASGSANTNAGTTVDGVVYPASARNIVVNIGPGRVSSVTDLHRYFLPDTFIYVEGITVATGAKTVTPFRVISASTTSGTTTVVIAANRTDSWWSGATSGEKLPYQPTHGTVFLGNNNVKDHESWAHTEPTNMSQSLVVDWHQTSRYAQIITDEYEATLKTILAGDVNDVAKTFSYISVAEQNAQMALADENKFFHDVWYGDVISELQSDPNNYNLLPPELDVLDNATVYSYKTRVKGIRTLLAEDARISDMAGGPLDLDEMFAKLYEVYRVRQEDGSTVTCIDLMTGREESALLRGAFRAIQTAAYGVNSQIYYTPGQVLEGTKVMWKYERYEIPGLPFAIAVFNEPYFDDRVSAFGDGTGGVNGSVNLKNSARAIWALDWSDINIAMISTASARRELGGNTAANTLSDLAYVIKLNPKKIDLRSKTYTVQIGDTARHAAWENFSTGNPTYTLTPGSGIVYS